MLFPHPHPPNGITNISLKEETTLKFLSSLAQVKIHPQYEETH